MKLDARKLKKADGDSPVLGCVAEWKTASWKTGEWRGPFNGVLSITLPDMTLDGSCIRSILLKPNAAEIVIAFASPVPTYQGQSELSVRLSYGVSSPSWWFQLGVEWEKWLTTKLKEYKGEIDDWCVKLKDAPWLSSGAFPLGEGGLQIAEGKGTWHNKTTQASIGLFADKTARVSVVIVPAAVLGNRGYQPFTGLTLDGLIANTTPLGGETTGSPADPVWAFAPAVLSLGLSGADATASNWRTLVRWSPPYRWSRKDPDRLLASRLIELSWNQLVRGLLQARRTDRAAQPWLPLPTLRLDDDADDFTPLLAFETPSGSSRAARLTQAYLLPPKETSFIARFSWQADAVLRPRADPGTDAHQPEALHGSGLKLTVTLGQKPFEWIDEQASISPGYGTGVFRSVSIRPAAIPPLLSGFASARPDPSVLAEWRFAVVSATCDSEKAWITLGSLEFKPAPSQEKESHFLKCVIRGEWTRDRRDLYPEIELNVQGEVRLSASADAASRKLDAEFDAATQQEEALHRDTEPLRHALQEAGRACVLRIRQRSEPGRNTVVEMQIRSPERQPLGSDALYFQARPFVVARVRPIDIDDQAGELIAVWRSDDADGVQWRVPDATLSFVLPPQAVGEEMERGKRFWTDSTRSDSTPSECTPCPYISPDKPLRYRFAPPTRIDVQPSLLARRYNKNPNNLTEALQDAKVQSFTTEMVYPVETRFKVSEFGEPDLRIAETAAFLGHPAVNLPLAEQPAEDDDKRRWAASILASEVAAWAVLRRPGQWDSFASEYRSLRAAHSAARANFTARLGQFHVYDRWRKDGGLRLTDGLSFRIRDTRHGAPPLFNPLPNGGDENSPQQLELLAGQKSEIVPFLTENKEWGQYSDGALRAGALHTIEFASELVGILRTPTSDRGSIDALAFTALGASGQLAASFDEGRTTFTVDTQHGQLSRLIKVRIGRVALLWNRAKHVVVYERTTVPSEQFESEQLSKTRDSRGWPILRKTEEYVEPIDVIRKFASEAQQDLNASGCVESSEFVSRRIYVNGAWGRDLGHGYELPLWDRSDASGFYPKPQIALRTHAGGDNTSRCWLDEPEHLYFYSNAEKETGNDPDRWDPKLAVDCPVGLARLPVLTGDGLKPDAYLDKPVMPVPQLGASRRPRFDLAIVSDGKINLQHGRGESEMLVALNMVSMSRTDEASAITSDELRKGGHGGLIDSANLAAQIASVEQRVRTLIERLPRQILESGLDCGTLKIRLKGEVETLFADLDKDLRGDGFKLEPGILKDWGAAVTRSVTRVADDWEDGATAAIELAFKRFSDDVKSLLEAALRVSQEESDNLRRLAHTRIHALINDSTAAVGSMSKLLATKTATLDWPMVAEVNKAVDDLLRTIETLDAPVGGATLEQVAAHATTLRQLIDQGRKTPAVAPVAVKASDLLVQIEKTVSGAEEWTQEPRTQLKVDLKALAVSLQATIAAVGMMLSTAKTEATEAARSLDEQSTHWVSAGTQLLKLLEAATSPDLLRDALRKCSSEVDSRLADNESALLKTLKKKIAAVRDQLKLETHARVMTDALTTVASSINSLAQTANVAMTPWLTKLKGQLSTRIDDIDCATVDDSLNELLGDMESKLKTVEANVRERVSGALGAIADEATGQRLAAVEGMASRVGKGIKLAKAIGELPELPTLRFNAVRAEYVFDDLTKQIDTSPFAARLREIDSGLKELGLAIPTRQLIDQIVPEGLQGMDFSRVFKNLGGMDFQDFFKRFRLPKLGSDKIKITHGLDKATRAAWVKTAVNADFPEEQALFEFSSMAVRVAKMQLRATNDVRVSADGQNRSITDGRFTGDWGLDFGGTRMATFKEVTVSFDGSGFDFDVSPDKVELHPSLKFIQEYAKQFQDKLPPAVQVEKDARGIPVGARASFSTVVDNLPPIPPVTIGPIAISSGLGLRMNTAGVFEISTHASLGSKTAPIFVQFGYLGGGLWLEAAATARGSNIVPRVSLGLALGSMRAFTLAGVARGSYALLLFAYAEIDNTGGSLRAGLSITGSARILGVANASLALLLEVEHHTGGGTTARGSLHVEIEICWCYTLRVHTAAEHKL
ncbi:MAG: hypothetical protein IAE88_14490 [Rhodobacteraceae bacterium]|nr:hypothetical protein [Paracoccaceae bacterium]